MARKKTTPLSVTDKKNTQNKTTIEKQTAGSTDNIEQGDQKTVQNNITGDKDAEIITTDNKENNTNPSTKFTYKTKRRNRKCYERIKEKED